MKQKKTLFLLLFAFLLLIGGASVLYRQLGQDMAPDLLSAQPAPAASEPAQHSPSPEVTGSAAPESSEAPAPESSEAPAPESSEAPAPESSETPTPESSAPAKSLVPDFTVYDADGSRVDLSDFFGKPIVVNFWTSWCHNCAGDLPNFQAKYEELGDEIHFLMINATDGSMETQETAAKYIADEGYTFPVFYDLDYDAVGTFGVYGYPMTFFIDAQGYPVAVGPGALGSALLQQGIDMSLSAS